LAADAELGVVVIDQLAQFTGIRAAETFRRNTARGGDLCLLYSS